MMPLVDLQHELDQIKTLIIDNYDSYTFNLLQLFKDTSNVTVIRNDQFSWQEFTTTILPHFDNIIISPGPGRPEKSADFGICANMIKAQLDPNQSEYHRPIFGVCLGHQGIGYLMGGKVTHAPRIMHGRMSQVFYKQHEAAEYKDIMHDCPGPFWVVRYHSLVVDKDCLPNDLLLTAFCYENDADMEALKNAKFLDDHDDVDETTRFHYLNHVAQDSDSSNPVTVMGFQHKSLPIWGVQFHPESVSTEHGIQMMTNFQKETYHWMVNKGNRPISFAPIPSSIQSLSAASPKPNPKPLENEIKHLDLFVKTSSLNWIDPEILVEEMISNSQLDNPYVSWLDSSRKLSPYSKFSVLSVNPAMTLTYSTLHRQVKIKKRNQHATTKHLKTSTFFDYISNLLEQYTKVNMNILDQDASDMKHAKFQGGLIGYFGYEMKRESMEGYCTPKEQLCDCVHDGNEKDNCCLCVQEPDAAFQLVDEFFVFDEVKKRVYICCLDKEFNHASSWIQTQEAFILKAAEKVRKRKLAVDEAISLKNPTLPNLLTPDTNHKSYLNSIKKSIDSIREGESYEICLTTRFRLNLPNHLTTKPTDPNLWRLYTQHLRKNNPAPFSALLMFPRLGILSSSPERFLKISDDHVAEMKPIKGTIARVLDCACEKGQCDFGKQCQQKTSDLDDQQKQQLWQDVKERAENLMIVDLIRNDLAQVCDPKSVCVPKLMHVETYEKVHHLVSTVRGKIHPNVNNVQVVKTCFPPGSMTGAPKLRSVQILDELEQHRPRGVYSGCLGYFSFGGNADFNVVIRTAVAATKADGQVEISVGGGGAITFLSDPEQEWKETVLKTKSVGPSVKEFLES